MFCRRSIWLVLVLGATASWAQWRPHERDSLARLLDPRERSAVQLRNYLEVASLWTLSAKARPYLDHADTLIRLFESAADSTDRSIGSSARIRHHYLSAYQAKFRRDIPAALAHFHKALELGRAMGQEDERLYDAIGTLYRSVGETDLAIQEFNKGLARMRQVEDAQGLWALHISMAGAVADKGELPAAQTWLARCDTTVDGVRVMWLNERARIAALRGDTAEALALYARSVRVCEPAPDDWGRVAPLTAITRIALARRDHATARDMADSCAAIALRTGDEAGWCTCTIMGGQARIALGDRPAAERSLRMALDTARSYGYVGLARASGDEGAMVRAAALLKDLYLQEGRLPEAVRMTSYWSGLKDTLNSRDGRLDVLRAEMHRQALADSLELVRRAEEERCAYDGQLTLEKERREVLIGGVLAAALVLAVIGLLLVKRLQQARRLAAQERHLREKEVNELLQKNEIDAMHAMFEGQENERDRVARDLHDRVGSMLGNVKMQMEVLEERMDTDQQEREGQYKKVYGLLVETVGEVRRISHDMVAGTLARFGLEKALEGLCDSVRVTGRLAVELRVFGLENRLERGMEITVYRIVQELVGNALKHAKATELSIDVTRTPGRLSVIVSDNGVGFDTTVPSEGMGLANVRKRAATIGGELTIDSTPGKGTTVSMECAVVE